MSRPTASPSGGQRAGNARRRRLVALAVLAAAGTGALTACGTDYPLAPVAPPAAAVAPAAATATEAATEAATDAGTATGAPAGTGNAPAPRPGGAPARTAGRAGGSGSAVSGSSGGGQAGGGGSSGGGQSAPAPAIASFRVVTQPVCAVHGTPDAPFSAPGSGVTIAWSVTGADGAALAVDNPTTYGAYGTSYPAKGQQEFPFTCTPGTTTSHTFTVWPAGAEGTSKTLTVSAHSDG